MRAVETNVGDAHRIGARNVRKNSPTSVFTYSDNKQNKQGVDLEFHCIFQTISDITAAEGAAPMT